MNKLIYDLNIVKEFIENLPELQDTGEVYFVSLAARNKDLSHEERVELDLGRAEMFARKISSSKEKLLRDIIILDRTHDLYTTRRGKSIPAYTISYYLNINPSNTLNAYFNFQNEMNKEIKELMFKFKNKNDISNNDTIFKNIHNKLIKHIQNSYSKYIIDIDVDIPKHLSKYDVKEMSIIPSFNKFLGKDKHYIIIDTKGGFHILLYKSMFEKGNNLMNPINEITNYIKTHYDVNDSEIEVAINNNGMVPIPGTYQREYKVNFIRINN